MDVSNKHNRASSDVAIPMSPIEPVDESDELFNASEYRKAIEVLEVRIKELENKPSKPLKSRVVAYLTVGLAHVAIVGKLAYDAFLDASWASDNPRIHLASIVLTVGTPVIASVGLATMHYYGIQSSKQNQVNLELEEKRRYKKFRSTAISFFQNPSPILFRLLSKSYEALPEDRKREYKKAIVLANQVLLELSRE